MTEYFGKGYRCRSLVKTLSVRKNNLSNVTILSLLWGNSFNPLLQENSTFFLRSFGFAAVRKTICDIFPSENAERKNKYQTRNLGTAGYETCNSQAY